MGGQLVHQLPADAKPFHPCAERARVDRLRDGGKLMN